jgi:hypothetical protein
VRSEEISFSRDLASLLSESMSHSCYLKPNGTRRCSGSGRGPRDRAHFLFIKGNTVRTQAKDNPLRFNQSLFNLVFTKISNMPKMVFQGEVFNAGKMQKTVTVVVPKRKVIQKFGKVS